MYRKYPSIENVYGRKTLDRVVAMDSTIPRPYDWLVQEKIHGANLQIACYWRDGKVEVSFSSRRKELSDQGAINTFYSLSLIQHRLEIAARRLFEALSGYAPIHIYGELFGGSYPHEDVSPNPGGIQVATVQKGVFYAPWTDVAVFDIWQEGVGFHPPNDVRWLCERVSLTPVPVLGSSLSLEEALNFPVEHCTHLPAYLDLPPIPDNIMEGIVIRPAQEQTLPNGARMILKTKSTRFLERASNPRAYRDPGIVSDELAAVLELAEDCITVPRLQGVVGKLGGFEDDSIIGDVLREMVADIYADLAVDNPDELDALSKADSRKVNKMINRETLEILRSGSV